MVNGAMAPSMQIVATTVKLVELKDGRKGRMGTGFIFNYADTAASRKLVIVTCGHVIRGVDDLKMTVSAIKGSSRRVIDVVLHGVQNLTRYHPDEAADLCVVSIDGVIDSLVKTDQVVISQCAFSKDCIPTAREELGLSAFQDVVMLGYPIGLMDEVNNLPVARKGMTATPFAYDFAGKSEFMLDIACFHGSSGSPVLVVDETTSYSGDDRSVETKLNRLFLLGIAKQNRSEVSLVCERDGWSGELTPTIPVRAVLDPANIAVCTKSKLLLDIEPAPTKAL